MNEKEKETYREQYHLAKDKGVPFFPNIIFKDVVVAFLVFLVLVALARFAGAPLEARADPGDTTYTPRPEWYFLFLFQLLKYFPGNLEVIGVFIIPTVAILTLFALPFLDRSPRRYFLNRPVITGVTTVAMAAIVFLTIQSAREAPPPAQATQGDPTAALYSQNCAPCHGPTISVPVGTNLHTLIAQGKHEGMPAWTADLTSDQIDALAGFILSPDGSRLFTQYCGACHNAPELVAGDPLKLKSMLEQGPKYPAHVNAGVPQWTEVISQEQRTSLLNFLVAPDGQRLFVVNCSGCHGTTVAFAGTEADLRTIISQGGQHLEMPSWREKLTPAQLDTLASYVVDPATAPDGKALFDQNCKACHGDRVPSVAEVSQARDLIANGGSHKTMPVWGDVLTADQMNALVQYTLTAAKGTPLEVGQKLFAQNCAPCHGEFGEGGPNPARPSNTIVPISTAEFLKTRDDTTLRAIISQGQPTSGMSPFGAANGGQLSEEELDAVVAYIRSWEAKPLVEPPPEVAAARVSLSSSDIYAQLCQQCHGPKGEGGVGTALSAPAYQSKNTDQAIFDTISRGRPQTAMIAWGAVLTPDQITQLVAYIRQLGQAAPPPSSAATTRTFTTDVKPILAAKCTMCHGKLGGWDATSYATVMKTGDHAPVVKASDVTGSLLAQKIQGTQTTGGLMPPGGKLSDADLQIITDWIAAGAPEN